jgi:hypothetical protein
MFGDDMYNEKTFSGGLLTEPQEGDGEEDSTALSPPILAARFDLVSRLINKRLANKARITRRRR